jgi:hypothetical protein
MSKGIELMNSVISFSPNRENTASTTPSAMKAGKAVYIRICVGHPGSIHKVSGSHDTQFALGGSQGSATLESGCRFSGSRSSLNDDQ